MANPIDTSSNTNIIFMLHSFTNRETSNKRGFSGERDRINPHRNVTDSHNTNNIFSFISDFRMVCIMFFSHITVLIDVKSSVI